MVCDVDLRVAVATRTHTLEVARAFAEEGFDVELIARGEDPRIPGVTYSEAIGTDHQRVRRVLSVNVRSLRTLWRRRRVARRLYVRHEWTVVPVMLAGRLLGYRVVTQLDDLLFGPTYEQNLPWAIDRFKRTMTIVMARVAHGIVAVTPELKRRIEEFGAPPERVAALPNGVDVNFIHPVPREEAISRLELDPALRYVLFCGNFAPWVDFDTLLDAFVLVARQRRDARLLLVGDGIERERVERKTRELHIADSVIITGFIRDRTMVRDFMGASVLAVTAHRLEQRARIGFSPVKLAEYLAAGRAVVATDRPGLKDTLVGTGAGAVVPSDPAAMSQAILDLLDPERADQLGANGRRLAEERFGWRVIVRATLPLFAGLPNVTVS